MIFKNDQFSLIFKLALPIIISNLSQFLLVTVDSAFLGNLNSDYLSSVGNVINPYLATVIFLFFLGNGITILIAHSIGAKKISLAKRYSEISIAYTTLISFVLFFIWIFFCEHIFRLLGADGIILKYSISYVRILAFSLLVLGIEIPIKSAFQGIGITSALMYTAIFQNILNILLDWLLIFGNLGFPAMGIDGAALATTISNISGAILITFLFYLKKKIPYKISLKGILRPKWKIYKKVIKIGIPSGLDVLLWFVGQLVIIRFLNEINAMAVGIFHLIFRIIGLPQCVSLGLAKSSITLVGNKWGEKNYQEAIKLGIKCNLYGIYFCIIVSTLFILFPENIIGVFTKDVIFIKEAILCLIITAFMIFPQVTNDIIGDAIRGTGNTKWMMYSQIFGTLFIIIASYISTFIFNGGIVGIFIVILLDEGIRAPINFLRFRFGQNPFKVFLEKRKSNV